MDEKLPKRRRKKESLRNTEVVKFNLNISISAHQI